MQHNPFLYNYEAEFISEYPEGCYFNLDLGFGRWHTSLIKVKNPDLKPFDKVLISTEYKKVDNIKTYRGMILKKL